MTGRDDNERLFHGDADRLRSVERVAMLEPDRVVAFSLRGLSVETVLDVGTGTGLFAEAFAVAGATVTGVDVSTELLAMARQHVPGGRFIEATAEALPFGDKSFDLVFLGHILHEADDPLEALREAARAARARVVIVEWPYRREESGPPLAHRLSPAKIEGLAASAGLAVQSRVSLSHVDMYALGAV